MAKHATLDAAGLLTRAQQTAGPDLLYRSAGSPEGAVTAAVGSTCEDTTNGEFYVKKTGAGNTGWARVVRASEIAATDLLLYADGSAPGGNTVANSAAETLFASNYTIPANTLVVGDVLRFTLRGIYSTDAVTAGTLTFKVKLGSTVIAATGALTNVVGLSGRGFTIEVIAIVTAIGAGGAVECQGWAALSTAVNTASVGDMAGAAAVSVDFSAAKVAQASVTWSAASASNTVTLRAFVLERLQ